MRKILTMTGGVLLVLMATIAMVAVAAEMPDDMVLSGCGDKKDPVPFPHTAHFEVATCVECHHTSEGLTLETAADMTVDSCQSCHKDPEEGVPDCSEMSLKKNPYHASCMGCHREMKKEAEDKSAFAAPIKCNDCHVKVEG